MVENRQNLERDSLKLMLRPILRFCLRRSLKLQDLQEVCKAVFLEIAEDEIRKTAKPVTLSRLSVMTGVHRKDVSRISRDGDEVVRANSLVVKVIGQWQNDNRFSTKSGKPRVLSAEGANSEFVKLVHSVSKDLNPYTVLFELERIDAVERTARGVRLQTGLYNPHGDEHQAFQLLARDSEDLMSAVEENIVATEEVPNLHISTEYDNIPLKHLPRIRTWFLEEGSAFHQRARSFLSDFDRDVNPIRRRGSKGRVRVAVGSFSRTEILEH